MCGADAQKVKNSAIAAEDAAVSEDMFEVSASPSRLDPMAESCSLNRALFSLSPFLLDLGACGSRRSQPLKLDLHPLTWQVAPSVRP